MPSGVWEDSWSEKEEKEAVKAELDEEEYIFRIALLVNFETVA